LVYDHTVIKKSEGTPTAPKWFFLGRITAAKQTSDRIGLLNLGVSMPLVEYLCEDCGAQFELLHRSTDPKPRICGYRCALPADTEQDCRGFGALKRQISGFATVNRDITKDHPGHEELGRAGFSIYANEGKKGLRHIASPKRPIPPAPKKK